MTPLFTRIGYLIGGALSVAVMGTAVIGANYQGVILHHLADVIQGSNTAVVAALNAPNWEEGISLPVIQGVTAATSSSGTLASSTPFYFEVSAIDAAGGTTTVSAYATATTDGTTTESILVTWGAVAGAQGYAVYFSTTTPTAFTQYFYSTTTNQYVFATSTGSLSGSYTKADTTAFATIINPSGPSYILGGNGTATTTIASTTALEIAGAIRAQAVATTTACYAATAGDIFYSTANKRFWGCNGTAWRSLDN